MGLGFLLILCTKLIEEEELVLALYRFKTMRKNQSSLLFSRRFKTPRKNQSSLVATRAVSSHSAYTGVEVDQELVRRYSSLPAQNWLEALELQRRVNEHAPDVALALSVEEDHRDGDAAGDLHHFRHYLRRDDVRFFRWGRNGIIYLFIRALKRD